MVSEFISRKSLHHGSKMQMTQMFHVLFTSIVCLMGVISIVSCFSANEADITNQSNFFQKIAFGPCQGEVLR